MADTQSRPWARVQDWVSLVAGGCLTLAPLWLDVDASGTWAMVFIGLAIVVLALIALAMPGAYVDEWMTVAGGVLAFLAPWLFSYTDDSGAAWTSWIVGIVVTVAALAALPASREVYRRQHRAA